MRDPRDEDNALGVVDGVDDPVVAYTNSEVIPAGELDCAGRPGV